MDHNKPSWKQCYEFYRETTGGIGEAVAEIVNTVIDGDENSFKILEKSISQAAMVSQITDDIRDVKLDLLDDRSPNIVKEKLLAAPMELKTLLNLNLGKSLHISYRIFKQLAPQTAAFAKELFLSCIEGLPKGVQRYLEDFYYSLPPLAVTHEDPLNKGWHTSYEADERIRSYIHRSLDDPPYKLVDFFG